MSKTVQDGLDATSHLFEDSLQLFHDSTFSDEGTSALQRYDGFGAKQACGGLVG